MKGSIGGNEIESSNKGGGRGGPGSQISDSPEMEIPQRGNLVKTLKTHKGSLLLQKFIKNATD